MNFTQIARISQIMKISEIALLITDLSITLTPKLELVSGRNGF